MGGSGKEIYKFKNASMPQQINDAGALWMIETALNYKWGARVKTEIYELKNASIAHQINDAGAL